MTSAGVRQQGRSWTTLQSAWTKFRSVLSWIALGFFAWGSDLLWTGILTALALGKQFPGAAPLLILGAAFPIFRGMEAYDKARDSSQTLEVRLRFGGIVVIAFLNEVMNIWAGYRVLANHFSGRVPWTLQDTLTLGIAGSVGIVFLVLGWLKVIDEQPARFGWVVSWRALTILALAYPALFVPGAVLMPTSSAHGLVNIGAQAFGIVLLLGIDSLLRGETLRGVIHRFGWFISAEAANVAASLILLAVLVGT